MDIVITAKVGRKNLEEDWYLETADGQQYTFLWDLESCAHHSFEICLVAVFAEAGNFSGRHHFDAQHHVGTGKSRK